jgi:hypothetical protein
MPFEKLTDAQIEDMFTYHDDPAKIPAYAAINEAAKELARAIRDACPVCADASAAIRLVREARMTANAAIALDGRY